MPVRRHILVPPPGVVVGLPGPSEQVVGRWGWLLIALVVGAPLAVVSVTIAVMQMMGTRPTGSVGSILLVVVPFLGAFFVAAGAVNWILRRARRRDLEALRANEYRACLKCRFDLSGGEAAGRCPECGTEYEQEQLKKSWEWTYWSWFESD